MHTLRTTFILLTMATATIAMATSPPAGISVGDRVETVIAVMGEPAGEIDFGERVIYLYDNGRIEFREGTVTAVNLLSDSEYKARRELEARQRHDYVQREERARAERIATAERLRAERLANTDFLLRPATERLNFWNTLQAQYPEVSFAAEIEGLVAEIREERILLAREAEIQRLSERTAAAEKRAAEAEAIARRAQQQAAQLPLVVEPSYVPIYYRQRPIRVYHINSCPYTRQGVNTGFTYDSGRIQVQINPHSQRIHSRFTEVRTIRE